MLSHFTEQYDTKYIFKGVSCNKDDCHREEKIKRLPHQFVSPFCKFPEQLLKKSYRFTRQLSNRRKRYPLPPAMQVCFPRSLSPDPGPSLTSPWGQECLHGGYPFKAGEGVSPWLCVPLGWGHGLNRSSLGGPLVPHTLQKGR